MSTTRCKIPIGSFYGHIVILPGECYPETSEVQGFSENNIQVSLLVVDIFCVSRAKNLRSVTQTGVMVMEANCGVEY